MAVLSEAMLKNNTSKERSVMSKKTWCRLSFLCRILTFGTGLAALLGIGLSLVFAAEVFNTHKVILDNQHKIIPWYEPTAKAYDHFLRLRWNFIKSKVPNCPGPAPRSSYPQYYFYCAFRDKNGVLEPDTWMNDLLW
jgi:hypothetical protein